MVSKIWGSISVYVSKTRTEKESSESNLVVGSLIPRKTIPNLNTITSAIYSMYKSVF